MSMTPSFSPFRLNHAVLFVADLERADTFYTGVFGMEVVAAGGLAAVDAGSLRRARELEALGFLQMTLAAADKISWTGGFAIQR